MKKLFFSMCCLCSFGAFAQNGFFIQPQIGGGMAICESQYQFGNGDTKNIFSFQGVLQVGYHTGKWDFTTGAGYLRTGYDLVNNIMVGPLFYNSPGSFVPGTQDAVFNNFKVYDPHIIVPVKVGYELCRISKRLTFEPVLGAEFAYNLPRTFVNHYNYKSTESQAGFEEFCNKYGVMGVLELNFKYKASNHLEFTAGPSVQYNFISEQKYNDQYDYSVLMNIGMRYNYRKHIAKPGNN